jgi:hypothetical protein
MIGHADLPRIQEILTEIDESYFTIFLGGDPWRHDNIAWRQVQVLVLGPDLTKLNLIR